MDSDNVLTLLAIVIALSAYLASVRYYLKSFARSSNKKRAERCKRAVVVLLPADGFLILSGLLFWAYLLSLEFLEGWRFLKTLGLPVFSLAALYLVFLHGLQGWRVFRDRKKPGLEPGCGGRPMAPGP